MNRDDLADLAIGALWGIALAAGIGVIFWVALR